MLVPLLALVALARTPATVDLVPTDDIWVYPHASDPQKDPFLRVWGAEGRSVAPHPEDVQEFSYSYLKWNVASIPADAKITSASLELTHVAGPAFTLDYCKQHPLEARPLAPKFSEKTWEPDDAMSLYPDDGDASVFGAGYPKAIDPDHPFSVSLDLLKGPKSFGEALKEALASPTKELAIALTSSISPEELGSKAVYKLYSKDADNAEYRPKLHIVLAG